MSHHIHQYVVCAMAVLFCLCAFPKVGFSAEDVQTSETIENLPPIKGIVFNDANQNGVLDEGEKGISDVPVSDQTKIVMTDKDGRYELPGAKHVTINVNLPAQWMAKPNPITGVPAFYKDFHTEDKGMFKSTGPIPKSVDFALIERFDADSKNFKAIIMGDSQLPERHFDAYAGDIVDEIIGIDADFVSILGDISSENLKSMDKIAALTYHAKKPLFGVIGNHDRDYKATEFSQSSASFKRVFGPDYYSFNRGDVHFLVLNTVLFNGKGSSYGWGCEKTQLDWIRQDLSMVPNDKLIVMMMHVPLIHKRGKGACKGLNEIFKVVEDRTLPTLALAGHWHTSGNYVLDESDGWKGKAPFYLCILPHACGSWWSGPTDYRNLPLSDQTDGVPNGWTLWEFNGTQYKCDFKPSTHSDTFQARIYTPDMRTIQYGYNGLAKDAILVNAFFTYETAKLEMSIDDGEWKTMEKENMQDPFALSSFNGPYASTSAWVPVATCQHMWKGNTGKLETGYHDVKIRIPQVDGRVIEQGKVFYQY